MFTVQLMDVAAAWTMFTGYLVDAAATFMMFTVSLVDVLSALGSCTWLDWLRT